MALPIPRSRLAALLAAVVVVTLALLATVLAAAPVAAQSAPSPTVAAIEGRMAELANQSRAAVGAPAVAVDVNFAAASRDWSCHMAQTNTFAHDPNFAAGGALAEIIAANSGGDGDMGAALHQQFMSSPPHREILLNPGYSRVGIGVCAYNGFWVTERFGTGPAVTAAAPTPTSSAPTPSTAQQPTPTTTPSTVRPAPTSAVRPAPPSTARRVPPRRRDPRLDRMGRSAVAAARAGSVQASVEGARPAAAQQAGSAALPFTGRPSTGLPLLLAALALLLGGVLALRLGRARYRPTHLRR